jgi:hypothetical protein
MKNITCSQSSSRKGFVIIAGTTLGKGNNWGEQLVKQKSETNELKTGLSVLSYRITQNLKELTVKNLKTHSLVCHIELLQQSALYYALYAVWEDRLTKRRRVDDLLI